MKKILKDKIAKSLSAEPIGKVKASGGYFGAIQLATNIKHGVRGRAAEALACGAR